MLGRGREGKEIYTTEACPDHHPMRDDENFEAETLAFGGWNPANSRCGVNLTTLNCNLVPLSLARLGTEHDPFPVGNPIFRSSGQKRGTGKQKMACRIQYVLYCKSKLASERANAIS